VQLLQKLFGKKSASQGIVGLSFLQQGVSIAIAKFTDNQNLKLIHCEYIPCKNASDEHQVLSQLAEKFNLADYDCYLVLTSDSYRRINIEAPAVADHEIADAIRWKINDLIEFPVDKAVIDFYEVPATQRANGSKMLEVIASPAEQIKALAEKCNKAGLQLKVIDIQETILRNLAVLLPENKRGVAILHLMESSGTILIQKDATIYLSRHIDTGYKKLDLDNEVFGTNQLATQEQNNLALEIQRSLDYVESYYGIPPISGLAMLPLAENSQKLLDILNNHHGITTRIVDLSAIVDSDILLDDPTQSYCSPVIGVTLRNVIAAL
jgi:MSHA biogenesis protein MshI